MMNLYETLSEAKAKEKDDEVFLVFSWKLKSLVEHPKPKILLLENGIWGMKE